MSFGPVCLSPMCAALGFFAMGLAFAPDPKTPDPRNIHLRGGRFRPLTYEEMTPPQKAMVEHILAGPRADLDGPFNVLLRSPEMGDLAQQFGVSLRYHSSLPKKLNEFAILLTARHWSAEFEFLLHHRFALEAGLSSAICDAVAEGRRPTPMQPDEHIVYNFVTELLTTRQVSDATFDAVKQTFGERGAVDLVSLIGYYQFVSMLLNVDRYPLPPGSRPELKPLPSPLPAK